MRRNATRPKQTLTASAVPGIPRNSVKINETIAIHTAPTAEIQTNFWPAHPGDRRGDRPEAAQSARLSQKDECDFISADGSRTEDDTKDRSPKEDESRSQDAHNGH